MASFTSSLALLLVALATVCFTLPVVEEQFSSSTLGSFNNDWTTEKTIEQGMSSSNMEKNMNEETTMQSMLLLEETSTSAGHHDAEEQVTRSSRVADDFTTSETKPMPSEHSMADRDVGEHPFDTTLETSTEFHEHTLRIVDDEVSSESTTVTDDKVQAKLDEEPSTTTSSPSFTSTSSAVAPHLYRPELVTPSRESTTKSAEHVEVEIEDEEKEHKMAPTGDTVPMKKQEDEDKPHADKSHEEVTEVSSTVYDGSVMRDMSALSTTEMEIEKNDQMIEIPKELLRPTKQATKLSKQPLNQGQKQ